MAGDWIKMRGALVDHPKVIAMTRQLHAGREFREWLTPGGSGAGNGQILSNHALRCVTTTLLMRCWSVAREHGKFVGDDLVLTHSTVSDLDEMAGAPGVGEAMKSVGWALERDGLTLPNFIEFNVPLTNAEKQAEYRKRQKGVTEALPTQGNEKADSVTTREEKRREEKNKDKAVRATRLPADWALPAEWSEYCKQKRPDLDAEATALDFAEHYWAKAGKGSTSLNWKLVWQGWVRRQFAPRGQAKTTVDPFAGAY